MTQPLTRPARGGGPPAKYDVRRIVIGAVVVLFVLVVAYKLLFHHRNKYESTADAITKAIAHNDMHPVLHAFNAVTRPELEDRARVGHLSDLVVTMGAFKGSKEDTPPGSPEGYHHFKERFEKGTLDEKFQLDSEGKITKFHIGPSEATPS